MLLLCRKRTTNDKSQRMFDLATLTYWRHRNQHAHWHFTYLIGRLLLSLFACIGCWFLMDNGVKNHPIELATFGMLVADSTVIYLLLCLIGARPLSRLSYVRWVPVVGSVGHAINVFVIIPTLQQGNLAGSIYLIYQVLFISTISIVLHAINIGSRFKPPSFVTVSVGPREDTLGDDCSICQEDLEDTQSIWSFACKHGFHAGCIEEWINRQGPSVTCPNCVQGAAEVDSRSRPWCF